MDRLRDLRTDKSSEPVRYAGSEASSSYTRSLGDATTSKGSKSLKMEAIEFQRQDPREYHDSGFFRGYGYNTHEKVITRTDQAIFSGSLHTDGFRDATLVGSGVSSDFGTHYQGSGRSSGDSGGGGGGPPSDIGSTGGDAGSSVSGFNFDRDEKEGEKANDNVNLNNQLLKAILDKTYKTQQRELIDEDVYAELVKQRADEYRLTLELQMERDRENRKKQEIQRRLTLQKQFDMKYRTPLAPDHTPTDNMLKYLGIK